MFCSLYNETTAAPKASIGVDKRVLSSQAKENNVSLMTAIPANQLKSHHQMAFLSGIKRVCIFLSGCSESHLRLTQVHLFSINVFIGKDNKKCWLQNTLILESNAGKKKERKFSQKFTLVKVCDTIEKAAW